MTKDEIESETTQEKNVLKKGARLILTTDLEIDELFPSVKQPRVSLLDDQDHDRDVTMKVTSYGTLSNLSELTPMSPRKNLGDFSKAVADLECDQYWPDSDRVLTPSSRNSSQFTGPIGLIERKKTFPNHTPKHAGNLIGDSLSEIQEELTSSPESPCNYNLPTLMAKKNNVHGALRPNPCFQEEEEGELSLLTSSASELDASDCILEKVMRDIELDSAEFPPPHNIPIGPCFESKEIETATKKLNGYCVNIISKLNFLEVSKKISKDMPKVTDGSGQRNSHKSGNMSSMLEAAYKDSPYLTTEARLRVQYSRKRAVRSGVANCVPKENQLHQLSLTTTEYGDISKQQEDTNECSILHRRFKKVIKTVESKENLSPNGFRKTPKIFRKSASSKFGFLSAKELPNYSESSEPKRRQYLALHQDDKRLSSKGKLIGLKSRKIDEISSLVKSKTSLTILPVSETQPFEQSKINCALLSVGLEEMRAKKRLDFKRNKGSNLQRSVSPSSFSKSQQLSVPKLKNNTTSLWSQKWSSPTYQSLKTAALDNYKYSVQKTPVKRQTISKTFSDQKVGTKKTNPIKVELKSQLSTFQRKTAKSATEANFKKASSAKLQVKEPDLFRPLSTVELAVERFSCSPDNIGYPKMSPSTAKVKITGRLANQVFKPSTASKTFKGDTRLLVKK